MARGVRKIWGHKNGKPRESDISPICRDAHTGVIAFFSGVQGDIVDVITRAKLYVDWFGGFGVMTPQIFLFSVGLAGRANTSVCTRPIALQSNRRLAASLSLPRDAMRPRVVAMGLCMSVCLSQVGVLSKRMNESCWFWACELSSTRPTLC